MKYHHATLIERPTGGVEDEINQGKRLVRIAFLWWLFAFIAIGGTVFTVWLVGLVK